MPATIIPPGSTWASSGWKSGRRASPGGGSTSNAAPTSSLTCWRSSTSTRSAHPVSVGSAGRKTVATRSVGSSRRRRTTPPTAWREKRAGGLTAAAAAHDPPDGLAEEEVGALDRGVGGDDEPRDVDALGDHVHGHQPARRLGVTRGEAVDPLVCLRLV